MLFEKIFKDGYVGDGILSLEKTTFHEKFDSNKLAFIIIHQNIIKKRIKRDNARDEVELLAYYNKSIER